MQMSCFNRREWMTIAENLCAQRLYILIWFLQRQQENSPNCERCENHQEIYNVPYKKLN